MGKSDIPMPVLAMTFCQVAGPGRTAAYSRARQVLWTQSAG